MTWDSQYREFMGWFRTDPRFVPWPMVRWSVYPTPRGGQEMLILMLMLMMMIMMMMMMMMMVMTNDSDVSGCLKTAILLEAAGFNFQAWATAKKCVSQNLGYKDFETSPARLFQWISGFDPGARYSTCETEVSQQQKPKCGPWPQHPPKSPGCELQ